MKKQVSAILAAGMAASLLVGCGGAASSAASSTAESTSTAASSEAAAATTEAGQAADITLWTYPIGKWGDSESVDALLADFNAKYPDIHVTIMSTPPSRAALRLTSLWKVPSVWLPTGAPRV